MTFSLCCRARRSTSKLCGVNSRFQSRVERCPPSSLIPSQSGTSELTLSLPVTAQGYRISVTHSSGQGPQVDATFTLNVTHP